MTAVKSLPATGSSPDPDLYDQDFFDWTERQARLLRERRSEGLDWANLAEEIESLGGSEKRAISSDLMILVMHLLKWRFQPEKRKPGWRATILDHRDRVIETIEMSPSLRRYPAQVLSRQYVKARLKAADETGLDESVFPEVCPFSIQEILDPDFLPEAQP